MREVEYKCVYIKKEMKDTEKMLNVAAQHGWRLVCSYAYNNNFLILEREVKK